MARVDDRRRCLVWVLGSLGGVGAALAASPPLTQATVVAVYLQEGRVLLRHADMPHLGMSAMTMEFVVNNKRWLHRLRSGETVRFDARRDGDEYLITRLKRP